MKNHWMFALIFLFGFTGCAGLNDSYKDYADAYVGHSQAESVRVVGQSEQISKMASEVETKTDLEAALVRIIGMMTIAKLEPVPFTLKNPTTAYDVAMSFVNQVPFMTMGLTTYGIAKQAIQNAGNINMGADTLNVSDSFNRTSSNVVGDGNAVTIPFKRMDTIDHAAPVVE